MSTRVVFHGWFTFMHFQNFTVFKSLIILTFCSTFSVYSFAESDVEPRFFIRAETSHYFLQTINNSTDHNVNSWQHFRVAPTSDNQLFLRMDRDTIYSTAVIDTEGGATIAFPDFGNRDVTVQFIDENHQTQRLTRLTKGPNVVDVPQTTKYSFVLVRIFYPAQVNKKGLNDVNHLQDKFLIQASSSDSYKTYSHSEFNSSDVHLKLWRQEVLNEVTPKNFRNIEHIFGAADATSSEQRLFGSVYGWGGAPYQDRVYQYSQDFDASMCRTVTMKPPNNSGYWSATVYNEDGMLFNDDAYINSNSAVKNGDGTFTLSFGCEDTKHQRNNLSLAGLNTDRWNVLIRSYSIESKVKSLSSEHRNPFVFEKINACKISRLRKATAWVMTSWIPMNTAMVWIYFKTKETFCEMNIA
ncbi:hypothetical protein VHA01S_076_00060 [Vibrio halioticoli NBRC 102217]|uniref:DUF1214 domain-containing protein n=1 Tax=Vibrio halioticoli NBRC 102217 TaxID=1219072 RepID=V5FHL6_9VIBR|nr:hypothetical protein VHA01S_076_00060 [Vibrio halioticoli NBRC 102217]